MSAPSGSGNAGGAALEIAVPIKYVPAVDKSHVRLSVCPECLESIGIYDNDWKRLDPSDHGWVEHPHQPKKSAGYVMVDARSWSKMKLTWSDFNRY